MVFHIPFRGLGRKIQLKNALISPKGDLKLQPYRIHFYEKNDII